jgi:membrane protein DedA with SNARE-associated domain
MVPRPRLWLADSDECSIACLQGSCLAVSQSNEPGEWTRLTVAVHPRARLLAAHFVPGLRTVAGPLAGSGGLPPLRFCAANLLGAICYVPWPWLAGYGVGDGLGAGIERVRRAAGLREDAALFAAILAVAALAFIAMTWARAPRAARSAGRSDERDL